ncbi:MAG TPA: universal stress protein [Nitrososphaeraceae archaeon]
MSIKKIVVAVDGSKPSFNASTHAINLAKTLNAELIVLHVIYPTYTQYEIALSPRPVRLKEVSRKEMEEGKQHVDKVKQKATEEKVSVKTDVIIATTSVVKEIVGYAEKNKIDMIVIGHEGYPGYIIVRDAPSQAVTDAVVSFVPPKLVLYDKIASTGVVGAAP